MPPRAIHRFQPTSKAYVIPVEILSKIFVLIAQRSSRDRKKVMLVCRHWHAVMLSTPGIPSELWIRRSTKIVVVQAAIQGKRWLLDVNIHPNDEGIQEEFNAKEFHACFTAATQAASRWRSLELWSFPPPEKCRVLHIMQPLEKLEHFRVSPGCDLGYFFEPLMAAVTTTAISHLTKMDLGDVNAVLYLAQPACLDIFCSLKELTIWLTRRMESPVNILPYLQRLETFRACHLNLPIYFPDASLPLVRTLHWLHLKSVSVQWMADRVFPALQRCYIRFPHHIDTLTLHPVTMPSCTTLEYESNDFFPLRNFCHSPLAELRLTCGQSNVRRGNPQLTAIFPVIAASRKSLTRLDIAVKCSENLLTYVLSLVPALDKLVLRLASPHALSETFFRLFVVPCPSANSPSEVNGPPSQTITSICGGLTMLFLHYKRWLRGPERKTLIPVFGDIVSSRWPEESHYLWLNCEGLEQTWCVQRPIEGIRGLSGHTGSVVGVSGPQGIVSLSEQRDLPYMEIPFKEAEYLVASNQLSMHCLLSLHHLVELRVGHKKDILPTALPPNLSLFHTLMVLEAHSIHQLFLAGQTFYKLKRCRIWSYTRCHTLNQGPPTEMPVCTRVDVEDLTLLATLKLPRIREMGVRFDHPESNLIWGKDIAVNAKLSGLELLHVRAWRPRVDLVQILRSLPVLKELIIGNGQELNVAFFRAFIPVGGNTASLLKQSSGEDCITLMLCPMLRSLLIEGADPREHPGLLVLEEVVSLRAVGGSYLKRFNFSRFHPKPGMEFELIKRDGSFGIETIALPEYAESFKLFI